MADKNQRTWALLGYDSFVRVRLVVEFEGVVSVGEVLLGLRFHLRVRRDPVKKFGEVACIWHKQLGMP